MWFAGQALGGAGSLLKPVLISWLREEKGRILLKCGIGRTVLGRARPELSEAVPPFSHRALTKDRKIHGCVRRNHRI